jgi:hypothetical protein
LIQKRLCAIIPKRDGFVYPVSIDDTDERMWKSKNTLRLSAKGVDKIIWSLS